MTLRSTSFALALGALGLLVGCTAARQPIYLEAEVGQLAHVTTSTTRPGYSGNGYVTGFRKSSDRVTLSCDSPGGLYEVGIRYSSPAGIKGYELDVNGTRSSGMFRSTGDTFAYVKAGKIELKKGPNTVAIYGGWNHYEIDRIDLTPIAAPDGPAKPSRKLIDAKATPKTRALMARLVDQYGTTTLSGVHGLADAALVQKITGQTPAILAEDLIEYSPTRLEHGSKPQGHAERTLQAASKGYIISLLWHWNSPSGLIDSDYIGADGKTVKAPWWFGFYTRATHFDVAKALANPDSEDYKLLIRDIDAIAVQLKKFSDADVPVLWRPLHEAAGGWFWWGAKGPKPFKQLWALMYDRLANHHQLHNLIWVYTGDADLAWYPGDQYVDIIGMDAYPSDPHDTFSRSWDDMQLAYGGRKLVAISEYGPVPDIARMKRFGARWSYFVPWFGRVKDLPADELKAIYSDPDVVNQPAKPATQEAR